MYHHLVHFHFSTVLTLLLSDSNITYFSSSFYPSLILLWCLNNLLVSLDILIDFIIGLEFNTLFKCGIWVKLRSSLLSFAKMYLQFFSKWIPSNTSITWPWYIRTVFSKSFNFSHEAFCYLCGKLNKGIIK